jgi:conjugal transfer mating pair stabilization protein TraG
MDFTVYVLGDIRLFADTLNGIAMIFTVASGENIDIWASNTNSMSLGMGALMGILLAICSLIYNAAFKQKFDFAAVILPIIIYICLTVPKVTVNLVDGYYRDGAQSVDNVPVGLALPLSAISSVAFAATEKIETVYTVPNNGTYSKITEDGFMMPLKLIHALRYTGLTMNDGFPNMSKTLTESIKICLTNNPSFNLKEYQNSTNSVQVLVQAMNDGGVGARLVKIFPHDSPKGLVTSCELASVYIEGTLEAYINGQVGNLPSLIAGDMLKEKNLKTDIEKILSNQNGNSSATRTITNTPVMHLLDDLQNITKASNAEVLNFIQATILNPQLSLATECVSGIDNAATARCMSYRTAEEQWKERSAAEASGFLSVMRDGQNLLILLSVTLFPIMILVIVFQGMGGLKVISSYLLYTISAYLWIPVAALINWFSQSQLHEEMYKWSIRLSANESVAQGFLSLANAPLFYDAVSKKLSVANSVMASVPVICMGMFGGMLWSMNRLVDKMNPQNDFDASVNTPQTLERTSMASVGNTISFDGHISSGTYNGNPDYGTLKTIQERALTHAKADEHLDRAQQSAIKAIGEVISKSTDTSITHSMAKQMMETHQFSDGSKSNRSDMQNSLQESLSKFGLASKIDQGESISDQEEKAASIALGYRVKLNGEADRSKIAAELRAKGSEGLARIFDTKSGLSDAATGGAAETGKSGGGWSTTNAQSQTDKYSATRSLIGTVDKATSENDELNNSLKKSNTLSRELGNARSNLNAYSETETEASSKSINAQQLANLDKQTGGQLAAKLESAWQAHKDDKGVRDIYNSNRTEITATSGSDRSNFLAKFDALMHGNNQSAKAAVMALGSVGQFIGSVEKPQGIGAVSPQTQKVFNKTVGETAEAANLGAPNASASSIRGEAQNTKGEVRGFQSKTNAKAHAQPHVRGALHDYEGQNTIQKNSFIDDVGNTGREIMSDLSGGKTDKTPTRNEISENLAEKVLFKNQQPNTDKWSESKKKLSDAMVQSFNNHSKK